MPVPWRPLGAPPTPYMDQLFVLMTPGDLADLSRLDELVTMLAPAYGAVPPEARIPASDPSPRFEYIEERLGFLCAAGPIPPRMSGGWPAVFAACRVLLRAARAALPSSSGSGLASSVPGPDLSASYGTFAARHQLALNQAGQHLPSSSSSQSAVPAPQAQALVEAALAIDREGAAPATAPRPFMAASTSANSVVATRDDLPSVQQLGRAMSTLPSELQLIEAAEGHGYSAVTSAHMTAISKSLSSVSCTFFDYAPPLLQRAVGSYVPLTEVEERRLQLASCLKDLFRGRCHKITERRLSGSGATSLLGCLRSPPDTVLISGSAASLAAIRAAREVLEWVNFAVSLFESEPAAGQRFFAAAREMVAQLISEDGIDHDLVADWLDLRIAALHNEFRYFYSGQRLIRPTYDETHITSAEARQQLSQLQVSRIHQAQRLQQQQQMHSAPPVPAAPSPAQAPAPSGQSRRKRKAKAAAPAASAPSAAAPASSGSAAATPAAAPAAAPSAAPFYPPGTAFNNSVVGGQPHTGAASPAEMGAFTAGNADAQGNGRCFNFWRRGVCRKGDACPFSHS